MTDYALEGAKWPTDTITWSFATSTYGEDSSDPFSNPIASQYQQAVENDLQAWSGAAPLHFVQVANSADPRQAADIRIGFGDLNTASTGVIGQTSLRWDGAGSLVPDEVVRLEDPEQLGLTQGSNGTFTYAGTATTLDEVALHELGHALGLAHSADPNAVMYPSVGPNNQTLDASDVAGIQALYGAPASSPAPATDTLTLHLSEDAWQGDAQVAVSLDGQSFGGAQTVTALHYLGQDQTLTFQGSFGVGPHDLAVSFLNDAWGGTWDTDRNLHVDGVDYDGTPQPGATAALYTTSTVHIAVGGAANAQAWSGTDPDGGTRYAGLTPAPA